MAFVTQTNVAADVSASFLIVFIIVAGFASYRYHMHTMYY